MEAKTKAEAQRFFSADCFNKIWTLLDSKKRSDAQDQEMLRLAFASYWHWTCREDVDATKISVALWMIARVAAVIGMGELAEDQAKRCIQTSSDDGVPAFYLAYAHEALARALQVRGNTSDSLVQVQEAEAICETMAEGDEKTWVQDDLAQIRSLL